MSNEHSTRSTGSAETRRSSKGEWLSRVMDTNAALAAAGDPRALKGSEGTVLMAVAASANDVTLSDAWPSRATIAARAGVSERMAKAALARLRDAGWLRVTRLGGVNGEHRATAYALAHPEVAEPATPDRPNSTELSTPNSTELSTPETGGGKHSSPPGGSTVPPPGGSTVPPPGEAQFPLNGSYEVVPSEVGPMKWLPENTSDAPPRRCTPAADAPGEAIARAVSESSPDSNSDHGPCATCAQEPGRVEVLHNAKSGKAHLLDTMSAAQRDTYPHAKVIRYCLSCTLAHRRNPHAWWTHTTPAERVA